MKKALRFHPALALGLLALAPLVSRAQDATPGLWPHDSSDLKPDPAVTFGALENGVRYAILPNPEPPDRISLRLYVDAGSLMETEEQQGLAHFIEHMAFNGTTHFAAGEMVEYFQRLGMSFGGDTNAHTSFNETVYKLELPNTDEALLNRSLLLLRDYADGMLMGEEELEKERGVILSELLTRDSAEWRTQKVAYQFALPDSLISKRFPIGTKEVIKGAGRETFMDYYRRWYSPERIAIVAVGAVDPAQIEALIKSQFGDMKRPEHPAPDPDLGEIKTGRGVIAKNHYEREASETSISIEVVRPYAWQPDNSAKTLRDTKLWAATEIIDNRLAELAKKEGAPFTGGGAYAQTFLDHVQFGSIYVTCEPDKWREALAVAEQEIRRALEHGFTNAEFAEVMANIRTVYEQDVRSAETRQSRPLADDLVQSLSDGYVFTSPQQDMEWFEANRDKVTRENALAALRGAWDSEDRQIFIGGNLDLENAERQILAAYEASTQQPVQPPAERETGAFAYTDFGQPTGIIERKDIFDLEIVQLRFANNVRLNLKRTDFTKDAISISARLGGGLLTLPEDKAGLQVVAGALMGAGGLEAHSADDLRRLFAGKTAGIQFGIGEDAFTFSGGSNREDLLDALQLLCAYLTAPGYREEALRQLHNNLDPIYTQLAHTPMGILQARVDPLLKGGDHRSGFPDKESLLAFSIDDARTWLAPALASAPLEVSIVGDFEESALIAAAEKTLGALPRREAIKPDYTEARQIAFPSGASTERFEFESEIPKAMVAVYWPTEDIWDIERTRRLSVLGSIFADRLRVKVREELGEAYSPYARNIPSDTYDGYGYLMSVITVDPAQPEKIAEVVRAIGSDLAENGTDADELDRALQPLLTGIDQQLRNNSYWLNTVAGGSQEFPQKLDWARTMRDDYESVTVGDINTLAGRYLGTDRALQVLIVPTAGD